MEKFYFFNSFLDTARAIEDEKLRLEYMMAVAEYWIEGKESDNPLVKALMVQTKFVLDRSKEMSEQKSEKMKWNKNAVKNWEKQSKQTKTDRNRQKQKKQEEEVEEEVEKENNNLSISSDIDKEQSTYWNEEINNCLDLIRKFNWWIIDWTQKEQRRYWKNLIWKLKEIESVKNWDSTRQNVLQIILAIISKNPYHAQKIAWPKRIYYELWWLMQICKQEMAKHTDRTTPFIPWIW